MKSTFIALMLAATLCSLHGQSSSAPAAESRGQTRAGSSATINRDDRSDQLRKAMEEEAELLKTYTAQNPRVVESRKRIAELERQSAAIPGLSGIDRSSVASYGQRLHMIVRRGNSVPSGSIIITSPTAQFKVDALSEDLAVLNYIFTREIERTFGEKGTEYKLGVPITIRGERIVETSYLQDFGVLVKMNVPFVVVPSGAEEKKTGPAAHPDSDWEKARRAVFGGDDSNPAIEQISPYDEKLVNALKRLIFDALKSAANIRHLEENQSITVVVIGRPNNPVATGERVEGRDSARSTILTVRVTKAQADAAMKDPEGSDLAKQAAVVAYFDAVNAVAPIGNTTYGGYGGGAAGVSGYGGYPPSSGVGR